MKKVIAALIAFAAIVFPQSAIAQPVANRDALNNIIVTGTGLAAGTLIKIYYPQVFDSKNFITSACNILTIKKTSLFAFDDWIKVGGVLLSLSVNSPPALPGLPCVNGAPNAAYSWINAGIYRYVQSSDKVYVVAPSPGAILVSGDLPNFRLGKVDKCGRILIKNSDKWPMTALNFNGALSYIVNGSYGPDITIPTTTTAAMPICYRGTLYQRQ
ncbi:hypothetical protein [Microcoleus sp. OTE_8_concoct_300]|uniref:hypothetical protein n=1 Tax=Microcoleus sp. OTE_8_concoct_300 TaxID=2964710 RepID=UPI00403F77CB